jgi:hypothetical protein
MRFKADIGERATGLFGLPLTSFPKVRVSRPVPMGLLVLAPFHRIPKRLRNPGILGVPQRFMFAGLSPGRQGQWTVHNAAEIRRKNVFA